MRGDITAFARFSIASHKARPLWEVGVRINKSDKPFMGASSHFAANPGNGRFHPRNTRCIIDASLTGNARHGNHKPK
jgi:hypothetical protein